ncbi:hypothetical protein NPIL_230321 [Nephila pilipes]|uniref:Uncharacterized protein n=1 Tax=Nephila pilipes TaxID=299642 RepID=A0A8X6T125_NEPPI|nr:hypothetical protein NPIL_230321 [Nephila pilipes]
MCRVALHKPFQSQNSGFHSGTQKDRMNSTKKPKNAVRQMCQGRVLFSKDPILERSSLVCTCNLRTADLFHRYYDKFSSTLGRSAVVFQSLGLLIRLTLTRVTSGYKDSKKIRYMKYNLDTFERLHFWACS